MTESYIRFSLEEVTILGQRGDYTFTWYGDKFEMKNVDVNTLVDAQEVIEVTAWFVKHVLPLMQKSNEPSGGPAHE